jgi:hypothetical protein
MPPGADLLPRLHPRAGAAIMGVSGGGRDGNLRSLSPDLLQGVAPLVEVEAVVPGQEA